MNKGDPVRSGAHDALLTSTDAPACLATGERCLFGFGEPRDLAMGRSLIERAGELGMAEAMRASAYLRAKGIGGEPDPDGAIEQLEALRKDDRLIDVQLQLLEQFDRAQAERSIEETVISVDPAIRVYHSAVPEFVCRYLILLGQGRLTGAVVGSTGRRDPYRDSDCMAFGPLIEDLVVQRVNALIAGLVGKDPRSAEPLALLRYREGQQYRPHHDAIRPANLADERVQTALVYLNSRYVGGETSFPSLNIAVRGAVGDILVFDNLRADGTIDGRTVHAGNPILSGEKWLATRWIRGRNYFEAETLNFA